MNFLNSILEQLNLNNQNLSPCFRATIIGSDAIYFENVKAIKSFSPARIIITLKKGEITLEGSELCVKKYQAGDLAVCGKISLLKID